MNQMHFSALHRGRGIKKKYAIAQQMQMFKKETQRTMGMKQQRELQNSERKTNKTTEGENTKEPKPTHQLFELSGGCFKTRSQSYCCWQAAMRWTSPSSKWLALLPGWGTKA